MAKKAPLQFAPPPTFNGFEGLNPVDQLMLEFGASENAKAFWSKPENGQAYLRRHIAEHPGTRPPWWWRLFAPRDAFRVLGHVAAIGYQGTERRESEAAYLARHGQLTPPELEALERGDLPAEEVVMPALLPRNGVMPSGVAAPGEVPCV